MHGCLFDSDARQTIYAYASVHIHIQFAKCIRKLRNVHTQYYTQTQVGVNEWFSVSACCQACEKAMVRHPQP